MRILRHEAGHALDTAFRLHFKRQHRELFGSFAQPYPGFLQAKTEEPEIRSAPAGLVRAGASGRRLCRDVCRLAHTALAMATSLSRLAGIAQARIHRRVDERSRRHKTAKQNAHESRATLRVEDNTARTLSSQARALRLRVARCLRSRSKSNLLRRSATHSQNRVPRVSFVRCVVRCDRSSPSTPACISTRSITCCKT